MKLYIKFKAYNKLLISKFLTFFLNNKKTKLIKGPIILPSTFKKYTIKKSPHVFGRSKENYFLKTSSVLLVFKVSRKQNLFKLLNELKVYNFEGLGVKISIK
jgi:ribosomal protein S10